MSTTFFELVLKHFWDLFFFVLSPDSWHLHDKSAHTDSHYSKYPQLFPTHDKKCFLYLNFATHNHTCHMWQILMSKNVPTCLLSVKMSGRKCCFSPHVLVFMLRCGVRWGLSVVTIRPLLTGPPCPRPCPRAQPPSIKCPRYHRRIVSSDWGQHCRQTLKSLKTQANVPTFSKILVTEYLLLLLANANALWLFKSAVKVLMTKIKFDQNTSSWIFLLLICHILFINWKLMDLALHEMWSAPKWLVSLPRTWCVVS